MGKEMRVTCDSCGCNMVGENYFVLTIHKVINGKKDRQPTVYLCQKHMRETKLATLLGHLILKAEGEE